MACENTEQLALTLSREACVNGYLTIRSDLTEIATLSLIVADWQHAPVRFSVWSSLVGSDCDPWKALSFGRRKNNKIKRKETHYKPVQGRIVLVFSFYQPRRTNSCWSANEWKELSESNRQVVVLSKVASLHFRFKERGNRPWSPEIFHSQNFMRKITVVERVFKWNNFGYRLLDASKAFPFTPLDWVTLPP